MASIVVAGNTSGTVTLSAPDIAGTTTLTLPTTSGTIITTAGGAAGSFTTLSSSADATFATSSGNVGIGTASPANFLDISKTQNAETNIGLSNTSTGADAQVRTKYTTNSGLFTVGTTGTAHPYGGDAYIYQVANKGIRFATNDTERMRIDSSGNVLVGTTTSGNGKFVVVQTSGSRISRLESVDSGTVEAVQFVKNSGGLGQIGSITTTTTATAYNTSSDYRLKEDIAPMIGALDKVSALKPVTYKWKEDGSYGQGFIAHELAEVVPDAVVGEKDAVDEEGNPKYQGVDTSFLVATLTAAIQEQQTIIETLKADIAELKAKVGV